MGPSAVKRWILPTVAILALASCGPTVGTQTRPRAPWEPELAEFFDDAADFIADPGDLQGQWSRGYDAEVQGRVDEADLICRVHIGTINEDINVEGHRRIHLLMTVSSVLHGEMPPESRLHLAVDEGSAGFDTVDRSERRLFNNRFVAFVRWYEDDDEQVRSHWHLSPGSRPVVELVRRTITERAEAAPRPGDRD